MDRRIPRRDFLNGDGARRGRRGAGGAAGAARRPAPRPPAGEPAYPPQRLGPARPARLADRALRRHQARRLRGAIRRSTSTPARPTTWSSSAAGCRAWRRPTSGTRRCPTSACSILDNHDDFGGHAKRNEFVYEGRTYLAYGGTMSVATPYPYSYMAKQLLVDLGVDVPRNAEFQNRDVVREVPARRRDLLRQGALRRGPPGGRHRPAVVARVLRQGAAQRRGPARPGPSLRQEPRLPARQDRRAEAGAARRASATRSSC